MGRHQNVIVQIFTILAGIGIGYGSVEKYIGSFNNQFQDTVVGFFLISIGMFVVLCALMEQPFVNRFFGFYMRWFGRGTFFVFFGCLICDPLRVVKHQKNQVLFATSLYVICWGAIQMLFQLLDAVPFPTPLCS